MCTTTYQNLGEIGVTPNESNGPSAGVTLTKFVCGLNPMRTRWIRHFWIVGGESYHHRMKIRRSVHKMFQPSYYVDLADM